MWALLPPVRNPWGKSSPVFCCRIVIEQMYDKEVGGAGSIKELAAAVTCLPVAPVAGQIEELLALRDCLDAKISEFLRAFDAELGWAEDGSLSLTAWLAAHGRRSRKEAHREAVTAKRLSQLPTTAAAWAGGYFLRPRSAPWWQTSQLSMQSSMPLTRTS